VNLIHAEDLAAICLLALDKGKPGEAFNVSDGTARTWDEIYATAQQRWGVPTAAKKEDRSTGKRISTAKLQAALGYTLRHPDLYEALALIESADRV
jgi:nucleoside-diphosphate-sugar epimerase